jgi:hypothetical protein
MIRPTFDLFSRIMAVVAGCASVVAPASAGAEIRPGDRSAGGRSDPVALYGGLLDFAVYRDGSRAGTHSVRFERAGESVIVTGRFELDVEVLFFTAYRFEYVSVGRWRHGRLQALKTTVDDNGAKSSVRASRRDKGFSIEGPDGSLQAPAPLYPTNHWNADVLGETRVLNTLTGRINTVSIEPAGREAVTTERGPVWATRYVYKGELETEVWYDDAGRWVGMRFQARDGSTIDYACRRCQGIAAIRAGND